MLPHLWQTHNTVPMGSSQHPAGAEPFLWKADLNLQTGFLQIINKEAELTWKGRQHAIQIQEMDLKGFFILSLTRLS